MDSSFASDEAHPVWYYRVTISNPTTAGITMLGMTGTMNELSGGGGGQSQDRAVVEPNFLIRFIDGL